MKNTLAAVLALALASGSAAALETATTGSQATQATVGALNSKIDVLAAQLQASNNCNAQRKFYAPADPKKDANGCVGVGDYDLNMASGSNVNFANGRVYATQGAASNYGGLFYGNDHGAYGVGSYAGLTGTATGNGYGVMGYATADPGGVGGYFSGTNSGVRAYGNSYGLLSYGNSNGSYGVYGIATGANGIAVRGDGGSGSGWAGYFTNVAGSGVVSVLNGGAYSGYWTGEFYGGYGVYISNSSGNAQLCLNGNCAKTLPTMGSYTWPNSGPGAYALWTGPYNFTCPGNQVVVGLAVTTAGTCSNKCNGDGPIIRNIQLICR